MYSGFIKHYFETFDFIEGAFQFDAALMFMAYNSILVENGISGDVLEIGVHHGRSAVAIAALRRKDRDFFAIDLFDDLQSENTSESGLGNKSEFLRNMSTYYENLDFVRVMAANSNSLSTRELGNEFSFCHIDGGHSAIETYGDLAITCNVLQPGGLVALDDYFNPAFPGVCEGAIKFLLDHESTLRPLAIGFNKVVYQKQPSTFPINRIFARQFSQVPKSHTRMMGYPVFVFWDGFKAFFDLDASTPSNLLPVTESEFRCEFEVARNTIIATPDELIRLPVKITNVSRRPLGDCSSGVGLSYHLWSDNGIIIKFDNPRSYLKSGIDPGGFALVDLLIKAPGDPGSYTIEIDIVWENVMWLQDRGNRTHSVELQVETALPD